MGLWQIADVPPGTYTVQAPRTRLRLQQVVGGVAGARRRSRSRSINTTGENQGIQFLATCTPQVRT